MYTYMYMYKYMCMVWLRLVGSIKLQVSFAKEPYKRGDILPQRPITLLILLTVATPYMYRRALNFFRFCHRVCKNVAKSTIHMLKSKLFVYAYMYVYICICMYIYMYVYICICIVVHCISLDSLTKFARMH